LKQKKTENRAIIGAMVSFICWFRCVYFPVASAFPCGQARRGDPPHGRRRWSPSARLHPEPPGSTGSENVVLRGPPHRYRPVGRRLAGARPRLQQVLFLVLSVAKTMDINGSNPLPLYSFTLPERAAHFLSIVAAGLQLPLASSQLLVLSNAGCRCVGTQDSAKVEPPNYKSHRQEQSRNLPRQKNKKNCSNARWCRLNMWTNELAPQWS
jgi:hypothetical protein